MKDALGNELNVGDLVALHLERPLIWGRVASVEQGGIVSGLNHKGEAQVRMGQIRIESIHTITVHPQIPIRAVLALRSDADEEKSLIVPEYQN